MDSEKTTVHDFWNASSCGEKWGLSEVSLEGYRRQSAWRYQQEPFISTFGAFADYCDKKVLEVGVGLGADHEQFARGGSVLYGIDLTERALAHTRRRFSLAGLRSTLLVADAEELPFPDASFDLVYSWGVLHHSPNPQRAVDEIYRVLRPGGELKVMIYHKYSIVGFMLWFRYAFLKMKAHTSLDEVYAHYLESPGTKAYTIADARQMFTKFSDLSLRLFLSPGDLLREHVGQRHQGRILKVAKRMWPRRLVETYGSGYGLFLTVHARKLEK